jgi:hypothetical protein
VRRDWLSLPAVFPVVDREDVRGVVVSLFTVLHETGEKVRRLRIEPAGFDEMEGEQPQGAFAAFRLQPQGQKQRADAVEERVIQPRHGVVQEAAVGQQG